MLLPTLGSKESYDALDAKREVLVFFEVVKTPNISNDKGNYNFRNII